MIYVGAATWLFRRHVLREEKYLRRQHEQAYTEY
jgi:protein-S-isoprenylcysteine O-methyltransferase Ste14